MQSVSHFTKKVTNQGKMLQTNNVNGQVKGRKKERKKKTKETLLNQNLSSRTISDLDLN